MNSAETLGHISESLELVATNGDDITDGVYERFFELCTTALPLMGHSDQHMRGRMMEQVIELLLDDQLQGEGNYFQWEIANHLSAYNVEVEMYEAFLAAVQQTVQKSVGARWNPTFAKAWKYRIASLVREVEDTDAELASILSS